MLGAGTEFSVYLVNNDIIYGVCLSSGVKYNELVDVVKNKFEINDQQDIMVSYMVGRKCVRIEDDGDLKFFKNTICASKGTPHTLLIKTVDKTGSCSFNTLDIDLNCSPLNHHEPLKKNICEIGTSKYVSSTPPDSEPVIKPSKKTNIHGLVVLKPGDRFDNKEACMYEIGRKALIEGFEFKPRKTDTRRYDVVCVNKECNWKIISSKRDYSDEWQLRTVNDYHTCTKSQVGMRHRNATAKLLGHLIEPKLKDTSRIYKGKDIQHDINNEYNIDISYKQACRSKYVAVESIAGCPAESFTELPYYCHNLELTNDGTVTHIDTDEQNRFTMVFIAFGVSVQAFKYHMRPLLVIDAAHLKGPFKGTNLLAVGMDGNNQIVPIATGVSHGETAESWKWFLNHLKECIGENLELAIISDRHASIISACDTVFPNAFHGYCCRHLMMNCKLKSEKHQATYWRMCKAYSIEGFNDAIGEIKAKRPAAYKKLIEAGVENWSRAHCTSNRYNFLTSNYAESINALTRNVRKYPVTNLMEWFRDLVQNWFCSRRDKYKGILPTNSFVT